MYANPAKNEYYAKVDRVRKHFGNAVPIGGYNSHDLIKLDKLDKQREADEVRAKEERPRHEAAQRQYVAYERAMKAWRVIEEKQGALGKSRRLHDINGLDPALMTAVEMPQRQNCRIVDEYDLSTAEIAQLASELEIKAGKLMRYVSTWESSAPDQRNLSLILALVARIERLEEIVRQ